MPDNQRQKFKPYLTQLLNTRNPELEQERGRVLAWSAITVFAPLALQANGLSEHAETLRTLPEYDWTAESAAWAAVTAARSAEAAVTAARSARSAAAAWAWAAVAAARSAAAAAAWAAAESAAWDLALVTLQQAIDVK